MSELPETELLLCERSEGWLTIWINRPEVRNALSNAVFEELGALADALKKDSSIRGVTLRGKGGNFSAGGDLKMFRDIFQGDVPAHADVAASSAFYGSVYQKINALPQVVVMLVEGAAVAGGLGLLCTADVVVATRDAQFSLAETTLGIPPAQIAPLVVKTVGMKVARRLMLTASRFKGLEAQQIGLVDYVVEDNAGLETMEAQLKEQVWKCAPGANAVTKEILLKNGDSLVGQEMIDNAAEHFANCMLDEEGRDGIAAFLEKRLPPWRQ